MHSIRIMSSGSDDCVSVLLGCIHTPNPYNPRPTREFKKAAVDAGSIFVTLVSGGGGMSCPPAGPGGFFIAAFSVLILLRLMCVQTEYDGV